MTLKMLRDLEQENDELRFRLDEAEQTLRAIRSGEVDSLVVDGPNGPRVYALEGANNSYRILVEAMNEGAATLTPSGTVLYCNRRFAEIVGLPLENAMGSSVRDCVSSDQLGAFEALLRGGWDQGASKGEIAVVRPDGEVIRVHLSLSAVVDVDPVLCLVATDLTDQIRVRDLREADRRKDEFLGMLSHELRNPLAPIRNSVYILKHADPTGDQAQRARAVIERQTEHLTRLVDDLLDVTRIARGKIEVRRSPLDLREVVVRAADDIRDMMDARGIAFRMELPNKRLWADADATRIAQVIGNLLHNAAKFTQCGDHVTLSLREAERFAEISVRDTGPGINETLLPRVFEAFVQGERTLARTDGGLGLGLALVKGITELHGGTVRVESAEGKGALFVVRLPLADAAVVTGPPPKLSLGGSEGRRVLVVDDNRDAAESLAQIVEMLGHRAEVTYDGASAIEMACSNPPDVVLCDIGLPGMSGYEVARTLRARGMNGMRLVAITGYAQPEDVKNAQQAGFDEHLAKPTSNEDIERILGRNI